MWGSAVTYGEQVYGAERSSQPERNLADIEGLVARLEVAPFDTHASEHSGQLRAELCKIGQAIGAFDMMIAGHARAMGLILITNNMKEFERAPELRVENWL